ncbi:MAG: ABC transporter permease [Planctomycetes bacterium]|nr:ABC transporter permease [Planctomycetota bacterium]
MPWRLVFKNITKHWLRSTLTVGSIVLAIFLLCLLRSLVVALDAGVRASAVDRLVVQSSVSLFVYLPESYEAKIAEVDGVRTVCRWNWFGGYYQEPSNFFAQFATDVDDFLTAYPEVEVIEGSVEDFRRERQACLVGADTASRFGFKVGDNVPLIGALFPRTDGQPWNFKVAGIYRSKKTNVDNSTLFFHTEYLEKALESGESGGPSGVGIFVVQLEPGADRVAVAGAIDEQFAGGPQRTQTNTEAEFQAQFVSMVGNVPLFVSSIGMGVMIAILLAALNTMLMAAREQTRDVGVLKALGFSDGSVFGLMITQSLILCGLGGAMGILLAKATEPVLIYLLSTTFPGYAVTGETLQLAVFVTLGIGVFAGITPAWRAKNLQVITALRATA